MNASRPPADAPIPTIGNCGSVDVTGSASAGAVSMSLFGFFFLIAIVAGALGFWGIAGAAAAIAKFLFFAFLAICVLFLVLALFVGRRIL